MKLEESKMHNETTVCRGDETPGLMSINSQPTTVNE